MNKINIKHIIFITFVYFFFVPLAHANVFINEVEVVPTEGRFIELYNNGSSSVDLTGWYIQRKTATGSTFGSLVSKTYFEGKSIEANGYFLISKTNISNSDVVDDSLTITESNTIQLKNSEGAVVDKVGWGESGDCTSPCVANPTEGKSIQRVSGGSWVVANSTPGTLNQSTESNNEGNVANINTNTSGTTIPNFSSSSSSKEEKKVYDIATEIISPGIVTAGIPFTIDHSTTGTKKEKIILGKFVWNFGDGMTKEGASSSSFEYVYQYPGDYVITLSYYDSVFDTTPDAVDRLAIKVVSSGIVISSVGSQNDPFVEIDNNSSYEMSLHGWIVKGAVHSFVMPEGMIILPNKKLKLSPRITGFDFNDLSSVSIVDQSGQLFASYPNKVIPKIKYSSTQSSNNNIVKGETVNNNQPENSPQVINLNDLEASALKSGSPIDFSKGFYVWFGLICVLVIGGASVILFRRKEGEYPDYVDKELNAKDMTIME